MHDLLSIYSEFYLFINTGGWILIDVLSNEATSMLEPRFHCEKVKSLPLGTQHCYGYNKYTGHLLF